MSQQPNYAGLAKLLFLPNRHKGLWEAPILTKYPPETTLHVYLDSPSFPLRLKSERNIAMSEGAPKVLPFYTAMHLVNWVRFNYLFHAVEGRSYLRYFKPLSARKIQGSLRSGRAVFDLSGERVRRQLQRNLKRLERLEQAYSAEDAWVNLPAEAYDYFTDVGIDSCHRSIAALASVAKNFTSVALTIPLVRCVFVISSARRISTIRPLARLH